MKSRPFEIDRRAFLSGVGALALLRPALGRAATSARDLAREAFIWGYPTVDLYAILRGYALDPSSPEFKAPLNGVGHARDVATPEDRLVIAPNVDTPYSYAWLDLRAGPVVVTVPPFGRERYLSLQLCDLYTWIIGYVTPRTNGQAGGDFLVVPPGWRGTTPPGIRGVFHSTTELALGLFRTQLLNPADLPNVHALQDRMHVQTLAAYLGRASLTARPLPPLVPPVNLREHPTDPAAFGALNWMLTFMPALPEEAAMRRDFASIGIGPGHAFAPDDALRDAVVEGMGAALGQMRERARRVRSSAELFGSREFLRDDYLTRAVGALFGILGNAAEEFLGVGWQADAGGQPFDGRRRYRIRFAPGQLPPVDAFWSITVYTQERLLYANPLKRYVINSPMLPSLLRDEDGGITLHVQHDSPGPGRESNWLPAPATPFGLTLRTYLPREEIRSGRWVAPPVEPLDS
ncbi:MAG TPA: DUF1254 domain-containing protein [Steroidobacteraceae bacterium]|nr:DUF1254 domain-containing protein [Steroidobacteraceae bacterium]